MRADVPEVFVAGVGMTRFGKQPEASLRSLAEDATAAALGDAGIAVDDLEAVYSANAVAGLLTGQEMIRGQVFLRGLGLDRIPVINVENACASGSTAFNLAVQAVAAGTYEMVLAIGTEKLSHPDRMLTFRAIGTAVDVERAADGAGASHSPFMDIYAAMTRSYMERSGATQRVFAEVAAKNQGHGRLNPLAQYGGTVSVDEVLSSRPIAWPLTLLMCAPVSDGAAAIVVVGRAMARKLGREHVRVAASVLTSGTRPDRAEDIPNAVARAARHAFRAAGLGPCDVDVIEVHDAVAPAELMALEDLGLAAAGEAPALMASGATRLGGRIPVNPSGGLLARGHPLAATGLAQLCELTWQLRGQAGARQVEGARVALAENSGGWLQDDAAVGAVHVLTREVRA